MRGKLQSSLQAMVAALPNPSTIKNFTGEKVGTGGMGNVFSATYDGKNVIVKQSKDGTTTADTRNTLHEVLTHESIIHNPNLPKIHGLFLSDDKKLTLVMEKVPGADCSGLFMKKSDWVTIPDNSDNPAFRAAKVPLAAEFHKLGSEDKMKASVHILAGIVNGLAAMHASGIGHYDLKPANMMFNSETMQGTLIDFGVSGVPGQNSKITASSSLLPNDNYPQSPRNSTEFPPLNEEVYALGEMIRKDFLEEVDDADKLPGAQRAVVDTAINILKGDPASSRPTMAQLNQIFKGEPVTLATGAQEGIKTQANLDDLKNAFGPNGAFGGGLDILSGMIARAPAPAPAPTT
jgi:serine/threonine protein kinase